MPSMAAAVGDYTTDAFGRQRHRQDLSPSQISSPTADGCVQSRWLSSDAPDLQVGTKITMGTKAAKRCEYQDEISDINLVRSTPMYVPRSWERLGSSDLAAGYAQTAPLSSRFAIFCCGCMLGLT
ncbi:hypothetical protein B0T21DRAFT_363415, partial [Apiosordaria backusii]